MYSSGSAMFPRTLAIASFRQTSKLRRHTGAKRYEMLGGKNKVAVRMAMLIGSGNGTRDHIPSCENETIGGFSMYGRTYTKTHVVALLLATLGSALTSEAIA